MSRSLKETYWPVKQNLIYAVYLRIFKQNIKLGVAFSISPPISVTNINRLRANVPNGETYRGNCQKINSAHILRLGRPWCETNHDILRLAEYRFIYEKIVSNRILFKCRFSCSKFKNNLEASRHKMKQPRPIKTIKSCKLTSKLMLTTV